MLLDALADCKVGELIAKLFEMDTLFVRPKPEGVDPTSSDKISTRLNLMFTRHVLGVLVPADAHSALCVTPARWFRCLHSSLMFLLLF